MVEIRPAEQRDVEALAVLMEELDRFYGATDTEPPDQRTRQITKFSSKSPVAGYVMLAWEELGCVFISLAGRRCDTLVVSQRAVRHRDIPA